MRAQGAVAAVAVISVAALAYACTGDDGDTADTTDGAGDIEATVADDTSPIVRLRDIRCTRVDDDQLVASGIVSSSGDEPKYVSVQVRFVDGDGVRVELATDSVNELQVGESARWDATTYSSGAPDVERCEVTATVS